VTLVRLVRKENQASVVLVGFVVPKVSLAQPVRPRLRSRVLRPQSKALPMRALTVWRSYSTGATISPTE
jgi:hypothetical protein